jgi:hypothetical protein
MFASAQETKWDDPANVAVGLGDAMYDTRR